MKSEAIKESDINIQRTRNGLPPGVACKITAFVTVDGQRFEVSRFISKEERRRSRVNVEREVIALCKKEIMGFIHNRSATSEN